MLCAVKWQLICESRQRKNTKSQATPDLASELIDCRKQSTCRSDLADERTLNVREVKGGVK